MLSYFYAWMPVAIVLGTVILLSSPYLALIALLLVALAALAALAWAVAAVPYMLARAVGRRRHGRSSATPQTATTLPSAEHQDT
jgi:hypothetical protein